MGRKELLALFWLALLISTLITWNSIYPSAYGAANTPLEADESEVIWWSDLTTSDETLVISYEAELGPIDIYVVSQDSYNLTSGELPASYFLHHHGKSTELQLHGPLPRLYFVILSDTSQYVSQQAWTYTSAAMMAKALAYPLTVFLIVVTAVNLGWYWKMSKDRSLDLQ